MAKGNPNSNYPAAKLSQIPKIGEYIKRFDELMELPPCKKCDPEGIKERIGLMVSDDTLVGSAPDITKHFIELRGIGIVDVKALFGALSVKDTQTIDLVIRLEDWDKDKEYDRLGLEENYTEYLGNKVVCHNIPIRPGRNLAVICETAAINHRQKKMGYNAAKELYTRVQNSLAKRREEDEDDE